MKRLIIVGILLVFLIACQQPVEKPVDVTYVDIEAIEKEPAAEKANETDESQYSTGYHKPKLEDNWEKEVGLNVYIRDFLEKYRFANITVIRVDIVGVDESYMLLEQNTEIELEDKAVEKLISRKIPSGYYKKLVIKFGEKVVADRIDNKPVEIEVVRDIIETDIRTHLDRGTTFNIMLDLDFDSSIKPAMEFGNPDKFYFSPRQTVTSSTRTYKGMNNVGENVGKRLENVTVDTLDNIFTFEEQGMFK